MRELTERKASNVCQFVNYFEIEDKHLLITEFYNGGNLKEYMKVKGKHMSLKFIWRVAIDLAKALYSLHIENSNRVIIHKDLKLDNVLFTILHRILCPGQAKVSKSLVF